MDDESLKIDPPLYLVSTREFCWRCDAEMPVVALLAPNVHGSHGEACVLSNITELPKSILTYVQQQFPTFKLRYSKTVDARYYANTCPKCGVIYGDFYLHREPGAAFFPTEEEEARTLSIETVPLADKMISMQASCGFGVADLILQHAKPRVPNL